MVMVYTVLTLQPFGAVFLQVVRTVREMETLELTSRGILILLAENSAAFCHVHRIALGPTEATRRMLATAGNGSTATVCGGGGNVAAARGSRVRRACGNHYNFGVRFRW